VCTSCGKRLQIGDQYAGRKVACPGCKTVLTAPGAAASPASPPPPAAKPAAAAAKPAVAAAKPAPAPLPPPPAPEKKTKKEELPFTFDAPGAKNRDEDDEEPPPRKAAPPRRGRRDDDEDDDRPARRGRTRAEEPAGATAKAWKSFGAGSGLARLGLWIEFLALAYGIGMTAYILTALLGDPVAVVKRVNDAGGPAVIAPMFIGIAFGSLLSLLGRTRMMRIPPGTGAKKVFFGAWALTVIRILTTLGAAALILKASSEWPDLTKSGADIDAKGKDAFLHMFLAFAAFAVGTPFWILADLSTIPAMAIVGGEIPDARLRQKAGQVTFVLQMLILAYVISAVAAGVGLSQIDWSALRSESPDAATAAGTSTTTVPGGKTATTTTTKASAADSAKAAIMFSAGLGILVQLAYTALFASMYGAGRRAAAEAREEQERAEDEDV
jgi:hypothetical protein